MDRDSGRLESEGGLQQGPKAPSLLRAEDRGAPSVHVARGKEAHNEEEGGLVKTGRGSRGIFYLEKIRIEFI